MSQKFLKSEDSDLKEFMGRCLTLLGEISRQQEYLAEAMQDYFQVPPDYKKAGSHATSDVSERYDADDEWDEDEDEWVS